MTETATKIEEIFKSKSPNMWEELVNSGLFAEAVGKDLADAVINCPQISKWHPEGSLYNHMDMVFRNAVDAGEDDLDVYFSLLLHDVSKPECIHYHYTEGGCIERTSFYNHDHKGAKVAGGILENLALDENRVEKITFIISQHMRVAQVKSMRRHKVEELVNHKWLNSLLSMHNYDDMVNEVSPDTEWILDYLLCREEE